MFLDFNSWYAEADMPRPSVLKADLPPAGAAGWLTQTRHQYERWQADFIPPRMMTVLLFSALMLTTQIADGLCTLAVVELGVEESNPIMAWALLSGPGTFMTMKVVIALASSAVFLVGSQRYRWAWLAHRLAVLGLLFLTGWHVLGAYLINELSCTALVAL